MFAITHEAGVMECRVVPILKSASQKLHLSESTPAIGIQAAIITAEKCAKLLRYYAKQASVGALYVAVFVKRNCTVSRLRVDPV